MDVINENKLTVTSVVMNRVIIVGQKKTAKIALLRSLFEGVTERSDGDDNSGLILSNVPLSTRYYSCNLDFMVDEYDDSKEWEDWCEEILSVEALELREAINGIIFIFDFSSKSILQDLTKLSKVYDQIEQDFLLRNKDSIQWEGIKLAVGFSRSPVAQQLLDEVYDASLEKGIELVDLSIASQENAYGEATGIRRVKEILETCSWPDVVKLR